jgi:hypothetical protein
LHDLERAVDRLLWFASRLSPAEIELVMDVGACLGSSRSGRWCDCGVNFVPDATGTEAAPFQNDPIKPPAIAGLAPWSSHLDVCPPSISR